MELNEKRRENGKEYTPLVIDKENAKYLDGVTRSKYVMFHYLFRFPNGYGASVIKGSVTYGGDYDKFELAVIKWNTRGTYDLCYDTPIASETLGYLTNDDVMYTLNKIRKLSV